MITQWRRLVLGSLPEIACRVSLARLSQEKQTGLRLWRILRTVCHPPSLSPAPPSPRFSCGTINCGPFLTNWGVAMDAPAMTRGQNVCVFNDGALLGRGEQCLLGA